MKQEKEEPIDIVPPDKLDLLHIIYEYINQFKSAVA
jgi:hypothetical protein